jgi:hypothetical protein
VARLRLWLLLALLLPLWRLLGLRLVTCTVNAGAAPCSGSAPSRQEQDFVRFSAEATLPSLAISDAGALLRRRGYHGPHYANPLKARPTGQ